MRRRRNPSLNNPYGIDPEVYSEVVGTEAQPPIELVALAAITAFPSKGEVPQSFDEAYERGNRSIAMAFKLKTPEGPWPGEFLRQVIVKWVINDPTPVAYTLRKISAWDRRLGVWCAAACAETMLRFVPAGEDRPRIAVEAAKGWVLGVTDESTARKASHASYLAAFSFSRHSSRAVAKAAAEAAASAFSNPYLAAAYAVTATYAATRKADVSDTITGDAAADAIRDVIARAIESYPVDQP